MTPIVEAPAIHILFCDLRCGHQSEAMLDIGGITSPATVPVETWLNPLSRGGLTQWVGL